MRVLAWQGMPSMEAMRTVAHRMDADLEVLVISSNEHLEELLRDDEPFDVVFPSDYLVQRLRQNGRLLELGPLPLARLEPWAVEAAYDPGVSTFGAVRLRDDGAAARTFGVPHLLVGLDVRAAARDGRRHAGRGARGRRRGTDRDRSLAQRLQRTCARCSA